MENRNHVEIDKETSKKIITVLLQEQGGIVGMMAKNNVPPQVDHWYSQGVRLYVDPDSPLGKRLGLKT